MALKAFSLFFTLVVAQLVPDPDHCYEFVSTTVNDSCGSVNLN